MPTFKIRLTSDADANSDLIDMLNGAPGVERVEEIADLMPHMDDPDSSSLGLRGDMGPGLHTIIVESTDEAAAHQVRTMAMQFAKETGTAVEIGDDL